jgi:cell wall-associated NlpC family hydrolase
MTTARTSTNRRFFRPGKRSLIAALVGLGVVLSPLPAMAAEPVAAPASETVVAHGHAAQVAVNTALAQRGKPYVYGAAGPRAFDCSGLTHFAYRAAGINLPRVTGAQVHAGVPVSKAHLRPGDLVFFYGNSHVGIYIGNGSVVHAPTPGDVVKVTKVAYMPVSAARHIA